MAITLVCRSLLYYRSSKINTHFHIVITTSAVTTWRKKSIQINMYIWDAIWFSQFWKNESRFNKNSCRTKRSEEKEKTTHFWWFIPPIKMVMTGGWFTIIAMVPTLWRNTSIFAANCSCCCGCLWKNSLQENQDPNEGNTKRKKCGWHCEGCHGLFDLFRWTEHLPSHTKASRCFMAELLR